MAEPFISICIPTYEGEKYLEECIDSCLSQTFKNYEIVICDDGSSDTTVDIIEKYKSKHPAIKFFKNPKNLGLVGNWNKCIELSSGKWIKFIFQDDSLREDCLEKFSQAIDGSVELIVCKRNFKLDKVSTEDEKDYYANRVRTLENTGYFNSNFFEPQIISKITAQNIALNFIAEPSLTLFKKAVVNKIGLFDPDLKQICDLEFLLRVASNYGVKYIPEQLCSFRIHSSSTTEKNITGKNYFIEQLLFALKLLTKPEFKPLINSLSFSEKFKIKLYAKYQSYKAFKAIDSKNSEMFIFEMKKKYPELFFKNHEVPFLSLLLKLRNN